MSFQTTDKRGNNGRAIDPSIYPKVWIIDPRRIAPACSGITTSSPLY
jgi:hypothetical protein